MGVGERQMKFNNTNKAIDPATRANTHPEPRRGSRRRRGSRIETESETNAWRRRIINQLTKNQWAKARGKSRRSRRGSSSVLTVRLVGAQGSGSLFFGIVVFIVYSSGWTSVQRMRNVANEP